ncbi:hypothetical protein SCA6_000149 [Theobroma cacao]
MVLFNTKTRLEIQADAACYFGIVIVQEDFVQDIRCCSHFNFKVLDIDQDIHRKVNKRRNQL